ncbi:hypothetical protein MPTK1_4g04300 [Marchantia polymorpha subsp. ruderalis]|uniref:Uncharacterized protein n=2 Tax=Marchantia polymorpha TaxID=3197 RepID=A0AAF6B694_MARPO|nr:hypothetical protein MARPO_0044s0043 [Marchantia polymorpha]BBN07528.1 hypothetical protein Mp_4g04300 [Marchantia polymorpha subsp. ruderalis]|eukprot:PTQ39572.1 hypothetical protein MARPO_0044s0043 [Marchantia polymorpha]
MLRRESDEQAFQALTLSLSLLHGRVHHIAQWEKASSILTSVQDQKIHHGEGKLPTVKLITENMCSLSVVPLTSNRPSVGS